MEKLREIENRIASLSEDELAQFRQWFARFDASVWDAQIERDAQAGKLDALASDALAEYRAGQCKPL